MMKYKVRSAGDALSYLTDCTLATVQDLAMKKSRPKNEYARQIAIAQQGIDWLDEFGVSRKGIRAEDIQGSVKDWAAEYEV